jgi:hypothetical protein
MADQAHNAKGFFPLNPNAPITYFRVAATQTLSKGDAVIISSEKVAIGLAASATLLGVIAQNAVTLAEDTKVGVWADPDTLFVGRQNGATGALGVGQEVDLVGATGAMELDEDASVTDVFKIVEELSADETDAAGKRWIFKINKHDLAQID